MEDIKRRLSDLETNSRECNKEIGRLIGDVKELKDDRKEMREVLTAVKDCLQQLNITVSKLEVRLDYEERETKERKAFKGWTIKTALSELIKLIVYGIIFVSSLGIFDYIQSAIKK